MWNFKLKILPILRRQFNSELESKSIKLIFNGQILDDDSKSLTQCGIFADAVVHCLMLQKRNVATSTETAGNIVTRQRAAAGNTHLISSLLNADWNAPLCIYILLIIIVTLTLSFCWYCRWVCDVLMQSKADVCVICNANRVNLKFWIQFTYSRIDSIYDDDDGGRSGFNIQITSVGIRRLVSSWWRQYLWVSTWFLVQCSLSSFMYMFWTFSIHRLSAFLCYRWSVLYFDHRQRSFS